MATPNAADDDGRKWRTQVMGLPSGPTPDNPQAQPHTYYYHNQQHPYLVYTTPVQKPHQNPCEYAVNLLDSLSQRAEGIGRNIWRNLTTGPSVSGAAWGKVNLATKAITEGGFESLFRQNFPSDPNEKLKKTFACYLSTTTGPVAGTLYLTTSRLAFCSDRPLSFGAPSGQEMWSYYKVSIPLGNIESVNPVVTTRQNPSAEKHYIHIMSVDSQEFWFMGLVNFDKACHHILDTVSGFRAAARSVTIR